MLSKVWGVPSLCEDQVSAIDKLLFDKDADGKMLGVAHTSSSKSHILQMVGSMVGGMWLIIVPLLSLTADTMAKMEEHVDTKGSIETHHLDEIPDESGIFHKRIIPLMESIDCKSSSIIFLFCPHNILLLIITIFAMLSFVIIKRKHFKASLLMNYISILYSMRWALELSFLL